jgi:nitrate reductase delta subunit
VRRFDGSPPRQPPYRLLSTLLLYPDEQIIEARAEIAAHASALPAGRERSAMLRFLPYWLERSPVALREIYVETFDLDRRCSLHLTYQVHGDTRKRGIALGRLKRMYAAAGLLMDAGELPDYLPLMLEFAEQAPLDYGQQVLAEHRLALDMVRRGLEQRSSPYAFLLEAVCAPLPGLDATQQSSLAQLMAEGPPTEQVGLQPFAPPEVMPAMEPRR